MRPVPPHHMKSSHSSRAFVSHKCIHQPHDDTWSSIDDNAVDATALMPAIHILKHMLALLSAQPTVRNADAGDSAIEAAWSLTCVRAARKAE